MLKQYTFILKENPDATLEDLEKPGVDEEPQQVLLRFVFITTLQYPAFDLYVAKLTASFYTEWQQNVTST